MVWVTGIAVVVEREREGEEGGGDRERERDRDREKESLGLLRSGFVLLPESRKRARAADSVLDGIAKGEV